MKKQILPLVILLCLVVAAAFYFTQTPQKATSSEKSSEPVQASLEKAENLEQPIKEANSSISKEQPEEAPVDEIISKEVLATRSMIAAHQSLRESTVADPDSKENKEIMQSMVFKALSDESTAPASNN